MAEIIAQRILRINKPEKLKLSATLSALSNKMEIIPTKLVNALKDLVKNQKERVFVKLILYDNKEFATEIRPKSHVESLKELCVLGDKDLEKIRPMLKDYAKKTLNESYALDQEGRVKELEGTVKSILAGLRAQSKIVETPKKAGGKAASKTASKA